MGGGKGRVPWARLEEARAQYILAEYLPNDVTLTQFHHIRLEDADALLKHWTQRQAAGEIPLRFKKKGKQCGKKASVPNNASDLAVPRGQSKGAQKTHRKARNWGVMEDLKQTAAVYPMRNRTVSAKMLPRTQPT